MFIKPNRRDALIVVDVQSDFLPGGSLAVEGGNEIIPIINALLVLFQSRVLTRDWHPADHISFNANPKFTDKSWPAHCVQNSAGAAFSRELKYDLADTVVSKGILMEKEAYSGFDGTLLEEWLQNRQIERLFITGLATDYCVKATALDARRLNFSTYVVLDAVRGVDQPPGQAQAALAELAIAGVNLVYAKEIMGYAA